MDQVGKRGNGDLEQPEDCPDQKVKGCPQFKVEICHNPKEINSDAIVLSLNEKLHSSPLFKINQCEKHVRSNLDTVALTVDVSRTDKQKFLADTGADISVVRDSRLKPGCNLKPDNVIKIKGISNGVMKTKGTVNLRLFTDTHETTPEFHVIGDSSQLQHDGILGRDFWESKQAVSH
jgi:hypothetical protein